MGMQVLPETGRRLGSLVERVSDAIRERIVSGEFKAGAKLPSEANLTIVHGVSRTVVREAIAALRADGLVEPRKGAGVFVRELRPKPELPFQNINQARISSILEVLELRTPVEIEAAGLAALRRSPSQEEAIIACHRAVHACMQNGQSTSDTDFALHLAIADATNNPRFREFLAMLGSSMIPRASLQSDVDEEEAITYLRQIHEEHSEIVNAISDGRVEAARAAMDKHLKGSQRRYRSLLQPK